MSMTRLHLREEYRGVLITIEEKDDVPAKPFVAFVPLVGFGYVPTYFASAGEAMVAARAVIDEQDDGTFVLSVAEQRAVRSVLEGVVRRGYDLSDTQALLLRRLQSC